MTSNTLYIIAGNMEEYLDWAYKSNAKYPTHNFYYVTDFTNLRDTHNPDGVFIGTWRTRKNLPEIFLRLTNRTTYGTDKMTVLVNLWESIKNDL